MINKIKNLFFRIQLKVVDIDFCKVEELDLIYSDLFYRKKDVLIVRNFFSKEELDMIKSKIQALKTEHITDYNGRYTAIPPVFETAKMEINKRYFEYCRGAMTHLEKTLELNLEKKHIDLFKIIAKGKYNISNPKISMESEPFVSGCLRIIPSSYGVINIHADNDFYTGKDSFYEHFKKSVNITNHVSYISMLQKPKKGGNLVLYNIEYPYFSKQEDGTVFGAKTKKIKVENIGFYEVNINEGDVVLFSGGQIWHSVNKMIGEKNRITFGGFSALSNDKKTIYLWT